VGTGIERGEAALARYGLPGDDAWDRRPTFRALSAEEQERVRARLTEACVFLARGYALRARPGDSEALSRAAELNGLAGRIGGDVPRAVWEQRARLLRRLGQPEEARRFDARSKEATLRSGRDYYLSGWEALT